MKHIFLLSFVLFHGFNIVGQTNPADRFHGSRIPPTSWGVIMSKVILRLLMIMC